MNNQLQPQSFFFCRQNLKQSSGVERFGRLLMSTLDNFLQSDQNFVLLRLLSQFWSVDHEKNIFSYIAQVAALWGTFENCPVSGGTLDPHHLILIWYTGGSFGLTPFWSDVIDYVECESLVRDVTKVKKVIRIGTTIHKFTDTDGKPVFLPCVSYHLPQTDVCLFPPQIYHQMHGGYLEVYGQSIQMKLCTCTISIDIIRDHTNLPVVHDSYVLVKAKRGLGPLMWSGLCRTCLSALDFFWEIHLVVSFICYPIRTIFLFLFPMCQWYREKEFVIPSEVATFVALETWYQYVLGQGPHAQADVWGTLWQMHHFSSYN